jgi:hypothetical protein
MHSELVMRAAQKMIMAVTLQLCAGAIAVLHVMTIAWLVQLNWHNRRKIIQRGYYQFLLDVNMKETIILFDILEAMLHLSVILIVVICLCAMFVLLTTQQNRDVPVVRRPMRCKLSTMTCHLVACEMITMLSAAAWGLLYFSDNIQEHGIIHFRQHLSIQEQVILHRLERICCIIWVGFCVPIGAVALAHLGSFACARRPHSD